MKERIIIDGLPEEVPEEARERINDAIHGALREDYDLRPDAVYWAYPERED